MSGAPAGTDAVRFESVDKSYGRGRVLAGLDLAVPTGTYLVLKGGNGAGKTTLLRLAAGLARPDSGRIVVDGVRLPADDQSWRSRIGFVSHDTSLYADLTVRENLLFNARLFALAHPRRRVVEAAGELNVERFLERPVRELSRGTRQRVALTRAFLHEPSILLLDEPYTGLDDASARVLTELLLRWNRAGRTIVAALHDPSPAHAGPVRTVVLADGRVRHDTGSPVGTGSAGSTGEPSNAVSPGARPAGPERPGRGSAGMAAGAAYGLPGGQP